MNISRSHLILGTIFLIGILFRVYNIYDFAEFRGDQGRDAIIIFEHWQNKTLPLLGPRTSTGQFPGPFFFYMIGPPLILSGFNPLAPTIFITILEALTIIPLFFLMKRLTNEKVAFVTTILYAISPWMIEKSRVFWNPTTVPFFTTCMFLVMYEFWKTKKRRLLLVIGILIGVMIQLHASTYIYIPLSILFVIITSIIAKRDKPIVNIVIDNLLLTSGIAIPLFPYLYHEATTGYKNILGLLSTGENAMSIFTGSAPKHYYSFIWIVPFILIGIALSIILRKKGAKIFYITSTMLVLLSLIAIPSVMNPSYDLSRTTWAVETMKKQSKGDSFAFIQTAGESVSDLHYRFFLIRDNVQVRPYESDIYKTLFVICDSPSCSSDEEIQTLRLSVMCYEKYCDREYPYIAMSDWKFEKSFKGWNITLYQFSR